MQVSNWKWRQIPRHISVPNYTGHEISETMLYRTIIRSLILDWRDI